jgi:hypothetical protein
MLAFSQTKRIKSRSEEIRKSGIHPYTVNPSIEDMELLEKVKVQSWTYPLYFTLIIAPTIFLGSLRMQMPRYFQNPLAENTQNHVKKVRAFKMGIATNIILASSLLAFGGAQLKFYITKYWMYNQYKHVVDRYKVLRD